MWGSGSQSPLGFSQSQGGGGGGGGLYGGAYSQASGFGSQSQQTQPFDLSQSVFGASQSQSQVGSQPAAPECTECHSTEMFTTDDGDMVCATCGTAYEGNVNEVVEMENSMLIGINRRRIKKDKTPVGPRLDAKGRIVSFADTRYCLRAFQIIFLRHVKAFCSAAALSSEATAEMKRVSSDVWFSYLERFTLPEACGNGGIRVRDDFRTGLEKGEVKARFAKEAGGGGGGVDGGGVEGQGHDSGADNGGGSGWRARAMGRVNVDERDMEAYFRGTGGWERTVGTARAHPGYSLLLPPDLKAGLGKARTFFAPNKVPSSVNVATLADRLAAVLGLEVRPP
ncbi:unnamed protein product [Ectocarpus fasciculatus]